MSRQPRKRGQKKQQSPSLFWWMDWAKQSHKMVNQMFVTSTEKSSSTVFDLFTPALKAMNLQPMTIFDPKIVNHTLHQAQKCLSEQLEQRPHSFMKIQQSYVSKLKKLFESTTDRLQGGPAIEPIIQPSPQDKRFQDPDWKEDPCFNFLKQAYLLQAELLQDTVQALDNLDPQAQRKINFYTRCFVDAIAPSNFPFTNPAVIREAFATRGENFIKGFSNFARDFVKDKGRIQMTDTNAFQLGHNLAATPGKVVFQNDLFQLIQYSPQTPKVYQVPLLIVPPWINKYYVFDLQQENSFIRWAVDSGLTVFIMSWINPDARQAHYTFSDYTLKGVEKAVACVRNITKSPKINTVGHCAGGVALTCLLAYFAQKKRDWIESATIIATPIDTTALGDILVYICEEQLESLEAHMQEQGYLSSDAMISSFNMLRANDFIWSFYINNYLLGRDPLPFDLLYWNNDATRMPMRMHSEYLRQIFLENRLMKTGSKGMKIAEKSLNLEDIRTPLFVFGAKEDHIVPWKAVYPLTQRVSGPVEFVLGLSGHVAGVMNPPNRQKYGYWFREDLPSTPESWLEKAENMTGSWWPHWRNWLQTHCGSEVAAREPDPRHIIEEAPGSYALTRDTKKE